MIKSKNTPLLLFAVFICLIFLYSCGDSSKEAKVDKSKGGQKSEIPAAPPAEAEPPAPEPESAVEPASEPETPAADGESESDLQPEPGPKDEAEPSTELAAAKESAEESASEVEPEPEPKPEPAAETAPVVEAAPQPEAKPEPAAEVAPEPEAKPATKVVKTSGKCPQPRKTKSAPSNTAKMDKTGGADADNGKLIYAKTAKPMACKMCHGDNGDGGGKLGAILKPPPRNFTCAESMKGVTAGQMFWIVKNGSAGTGMVAHSKTLKDAEIWDVVKFIRSEFMH